MIVTGEDKVLEQKPIGIIFSTIYLTWAGLGLNSGLCNEKLTVMRHEIRVCGVNDIKVYFRL
jgi:hypothetical protein